MSSVQVGITLPTRESALLGVQDAAPLMKLARQVEDLGYDSVWAGDSFVARRRLEPMTLLAAISVATDRVLIGTAALIVPGREPVSLAHTIVTLDQLSGGRLRMGIGTGWPLPVKAEHDAVTMTFRERCERVDEMVSGWRRAWSGEDGDLVGKYFDLNALLDQPAPLRRGGPPLWLASNGRPVAAARIAENYDGWMPILPDADDYGRYWHDIRSRTSAAGRDADAVTPCLYANVNINRDADLARLGLDAYTRRYNGLPLSAMKDYQLYFGGSTKAFTAWLQDYVRAGARQIVLRIATFDNYERQLRAIADEVVPALHAMSSGH
jgi:alkanesulfonate monooxygenase SsuD/methylene tetrahydromethanopterin reductase-like flavin-dependent oxidoreductase (luciferase family)